VSGKRRAAGPAQKSQAQKGQGQKSTAKKKAGAKPPRTRKQKLKRIAKWVSITGLVCVLLAVAGFVYLYRTTEIPDPNEEFRTQTSFVYYADGKAEVGSFVTQNRVSIPLDQMPQTVQDAVVAAENRTFWSDRGIDPKGIVRAFFNNASGNSTQGASTITQQYVKILYLTQERSYQRKLKEAILSLKLQRTMSKSEILEGYLNTIYFGRGAYGIQAAAEAFFDKDAADLNLRESAALASILNNPSRFEPREGKEARQALKSRYVWVLDGMAETGSITERQAERAQRRLPKFPQIQAESRLGGQKGHMLAMVRNELHAMGYEDQEIDGGGLRVTTTFTQKAMAAAEEGALEIRPDMGKDNKDLHVAVASVEPGTGAVRGFYAGQDYIDSQINWAVTGSAVGSTFKPFAVAAALKQGFSLRDTFEGNSPYYYNGEGTGDRVRNEGSGSDGLGSDYGSAVSLLRATQDSINTAFADLTMAMDDGPVSIVETAEDLGIPNWDRQQTGYNNIDNSPGLEPVAGVALGSATIAPVNMANAYATIANGGRRADVHVIDKIVSKSGEVLYERKQRTREAIDEDVAADTSYAMQQVVSAGTGRAALALGRPAGGKTGTATNADDDVSSSWFVGYTPQLATAVMYARGKGNEQLDGWLPTYNGMAGYYGANYPARTFTEVMRRSLEGEPVETFPPPAWLDGEAPSDGHEPAPTRPPQTKKPKPTKSPSKSPTKQPSPTKTPSPTQSQEPTPSETPEPSETAQPTQTPTATATGGSGNQAGRRGRSDS